MMAYTDFVEEKYLTKARKNLAELVDSYANLPEEIQNELTFYVALQQRGLTIETEKDVLNDPSERTVFRWHQKQGRIHNFLNAWKYVTKDVDNKSKKIILDSPLFFNSELMAWFNRLTFSRKLDMNDTYALEYFDKYIDYDFAKEYNPTYIDLHITHH